MIEVAGGGLAEADEGFCHEIGTKSFEDTDSPLALQFAFARDNGLKCARGQLLLNSPSG